MMSGDDARRYVEYVEIGRGRNGTVYRVRDTGSGRNMVVKRFREKDKDGGMIAETLREVSILRQLRHPNILEVSGTFVLDGCVCMASPMFDLDLKMLLAGTPGLHPDILQSFGFQLLSGLNYIHVHMMVHRDIKPENILVDRVESRVVFCDFGCARRMMFDRNDYTVEVCTIEYRPPELLVKPMRYGSSLDIWSLGVVFAEMEKGTVPFPGEVEMEVLGSIERVLGGIGYEGDEAPPPQRHAGRALGIEDEEFGDLVNGMLQVDPSRRITAERALKHPYFRKVPAAVRRMCTPHPQQGAVAPP
jgi:serine/threonine protein kinase